MTAFFAGLAPAPPDSILGLMEAFRADPSPAKINLAAGVFVDETGERPSWPRWPRPSAASSTTR